MKRTTSWTVGVLLSLGLTATVWLNWPPSAFTFPTLSHAEIANLTGTAEDNYRLRVHLTALRYSKVMKPWSELAEPARSLWAVLCFDNVVANGGKVSAYRFMLTQDPTLPTLADAADGYRNLEAPRLAAWLSAAASLPDGAHERVPADLLAEGHAAWVTCVKKRSEEIARAKP